MSEKHTCSGVVYTRGFGGTWACPNNGRTFEDNKWWCKRHLPSAIRAREKKRDGKFKKAFAESAAKQDAVKRARKRADHWAEVGPELLDALVKARASLKDVNEDCYGSYHALEWLDDAIEKAEEIK